MIFLEQIVNQALLEEGQLIVELEALQLTWETLESLFVGIYNQSAAYLTIYDWTSDVIGPNPKRKDDILYVKHLSINTGTGMQRMMPDMDHKLWEWNPDTKNLNSLMNMNFYLDVGKAPTCEQLEYKMPMTFIKDRKQFFRLPCTFEPDTFSLGDLTAVYDRRNKNKIIIDGSNAVGEFDTKNLNGYLIFDENYKGTMSIVSKYVGIKELDLSCDLFYTWFKGALLTLMGSMKKQVDLQGVGLPFDISADGLLERGRQLIDSINDLKCNKSNWSNF